jgi:hypothetical protein
MDGLPRGRLLLALHALIAAAIHRVVHDSSIEGIVLLLLVFCPRHYTAANYSQSTGVFWLALLLKLRASLDRASHCIIVRSCRYIAGRILFHVLVLVGNIRVLGQPASELGLVPTRLTVVLLILLLGWARIHQILAKLSLADHWVLILKLVSRTQCRTLVHQSYLVLEFDWVHGGSQGTIIQRVATAHVKPLLLVLIRGLTNLVHSSILLNVPILVFLALSGPSGVPVPFCVWDRIGCYGSRRVGKQQRVIELTTIVSHVDGLQVLRLKQGVWAALFRGASLGAQVQVWSLVFVKQSVQLVVGALHRVYLLLVVLDRCVIITVWGVVHHDVFVPDVWGALLVALIVAECHGHLMHVKRTI